MRKQYNNVLKSFFHEKPLHRREDLGITQEEMAHRLSMANRTYVDLDYGKIRHGDGSMSPDKKH